ncbi:CobW family GTP-binding protein [Marinomonas aquiplantarum]|uniref:G3E family GTPase n=1 Tax=Marinomonas aquiplantarum TaxID=491951 RepID=A0A366D338_9GAMM|nr:GTP-binding protein [Marinomonas aquiplantarum]RBO83929.1 G3E family GTPase [Marinomonas aquiplantarum]
MTYQNIPVNIITGFLGSGKTTLIRQLLSKAPAGEHWAILVNEFGEVGIDGALLADSGASIKEVPGGCLCCVTSAAFSTGLNALIKQVNPDRILIEPTGIGHPAQIMAQLQAEHYRDVLDVKASVCLLDVRNLQDPRYLGHPAFFDQIDQADVLIASKADQYSDVEQDQFLAFVAQLNDPKKYAFSYHGDIALSWLDYSKSNASSVLPHHHAHHDHSNHHHSHDHENSHHHESDTLRFQHEKITCYEKRDQTLCSIGWVIAGEMHFQQDTVENLAHQLKQHKGFWRLKGRLNLNDDSAIECNITQNELAFAMQDSVSQSKIECLVDNESQLVEVKSLIETALF